MKTFKPIRTVTCKCDACLEEAEYRPYSHKFDSVSQMVVCHECSDDFEQSAKVYETPVKWGEVPETRVNYDEREYEPDYDND